MSEQQIQICPRCNVEYTEYPALSRRDNKTNICDACGTMESINDAQPIHEIGLIRLAEEMKFMEKIGENYAEWYVWKKGNMK